jgi:DNA repair protein RadA
MSIFQNLPIDLEKLKDLNREQWINDSFLSLLNTHELKNFLNFSLSPNSNQKFDQILDRNKKNHQINAKIFSEPDQNQWNLPTNSNNINLLLDGNGIQSKEITLFYGKFRTGKSQLAHQSVVNLFKKFSNKENSDIGDFSALFIDTEGTFRPGRIKDMAMKQNVPFESILKRTIVIKIDSLNNFDMVLSNINSIIEENRIKLVVVDSLTSYYRLELGNSENSFHAVIKSLVSNLNILLNCAKQHNIPIICTSQITASMSKASFFDVQPILKNVLNSYIKMWILLAENEFITSTIENRGRRDAHLINSQNTDEKIAQFIITTGGIEDYF